MHAINYLLRNVENNYYDIEWLNEYTVKHLEQSLFCSILMISRL